MKHVPDFEGGACSRNTPASTDGIEKEVVRVASRLPHGEAAQLLPLEACTLGSKRERVVERDQHAGCSVVDEGLEDREW